MFVVTHSHDAYPQTELGKPETVIISGGDAAQLAGPVIWACVGTTRRKRWERMKRQWKLANFARRRHTSDKRVLTEPQRAVRAAVDAER